MSVTTPQAPQRPSTLAAFRTAPMSVKVLASILYGVGLFTLLQEAILVARVLADVGLISPAARGTAMVADLFAVVVALISFLLGRGITRGSYVLWLLTLIFTVLGLVQSVLWVLISVADARTFLILGVAVAVLALLLTPAVRRHCAKR